MPGRRTRARRPPDLEIEAEGVARYDASRETRTGTPEVILAEGKTTAHLLALVSALHGAGRGALVSRLNAGQRRALASGAREARFRVTFLAEGRLARLEGSLPLPSRDGIVAIVTAGTSDVPIAEESRAVLESYGVRTVTAYDVGVAGLHRLRRAVGRLERRRPAVYLAFAGREGALPTVLAGLVRAPVVGVPTSTGYGRGGRGEAALSAMLQSCAPIAVVNIDAGVPAALFALHLLSGRARPPGASR
ncbi:MAG TPA: nickel pincer cofactor biosynthesis protein LarB [Thermoplasmata archaeon]|nr:nickel pincer cofactor biosynthesis protein LarB [Thermoplasmata archaeon]